MSKPLKGSWQLQEAKARLSELVKKATSEGPQEITVHGKPAVVVMSREAYEKLRSGGKKGTSKKSTFLEFMRASPLVGVKLDLRRSKDATWRKLDLFDDDK
jgi:prevent-host-death family protein